MTASMLGTIFGIPTVPVQNSPNPQITGAHVPAHGNGVIFSVNSSIEGLLADDFAVEADGVSVPIFRMGGGGTRWEVEFDTDWIANGQTVAFTYSGHRMPAFADADVENNSVVVARAAQLVKRERAFGIHFNEATATVLIDGNQLAAGDSNPDLFNPTALTSPASIDHWLDAAESFGAQTVVITTKHVDGLCIWDSASTPTRNIRSAATWWAASGFDIVLAFANRARSRGLRVGFYYSIWDRAFELANPGATDEEYTAHVAAHVTELLSDFGPVSEILFDAWTGIASYPSYTKVNKETIFALVRSLQPDCVTMVNGYSGDLSDTEVNIFETAITGHDFPTLSNRMPARLWRTPDGTEHSWFDEPARRGDYLSVEAHRVVIAEARARRCEVLFNLSPDATGLIDAGRMAYLAAIGAP